MRALYVIDGPIKGKSFTLHDGMTTIGRSSDNDISISDRTVSRHHAKLVKKDGRISIVDLNSLRGVIIDGDKIEPGLEVELEKDSKVRMGKTVLAFQKKASEQTAAQPYPGTNHKIPSDTSKSSSAPDSPRNYTRSLDLLLKVSNLFARSLDIDKLLGEVIDQVFVLLKRIDRGAILLVNKETGALEEAVSKTRMKDKGGLSSEITYSRTIVKRTIEDGQPVIISDTSRVKKADLSNSMERMKVRSVMCVPLTYKGDVKGVIYVDSIGLPEGFRKNDLQVLTGLSNTAAIAIENARLYGELKQELAERKRTEAALQKARDQLEEQVEKRTAELSKTIELLSQEIANRKRAEEALRDSEEKYRSLVESTEDSVYLVDRNCRYLFMNKKHLARFGLPADKVIGRTYGEFHSEDETKEFANKLNKVFKTARSLSYEYRSQRDGGYFIRTLSPAREPHGGTAAVTVVSKDITERKQAEEEKKTLDAQLSHAQKMESLGRIAGGVAHNFRNVLQAIMGNSQFVQMAYSQDERLQEITSAIEESGKKGSHFIDSLLRFSRQEAEIEMLPLDLRDVLDETYRIISNTFDKGIRITTKIAEPLPITGDRSSLNQVFINLCNNARDSMPDGGELRIEASRGKEAVMVTISDTGCGMDEESLKNIFDPFYTTKDVGQGTGLGLSITHGIVEEHKGKISVASQPGKGTIFKVSFPVAEESGRIESEPPLRIRHGKGEKVLIVDDEPEVLKGLENMVRAIGYKVDSARSGNQALEGYKTNRPDLVLLDWKMPHMDGAMCAKKILDIDPAARILIITGHQEVAKDKTDVCLKSIIKGFILKPCDLKKLSRVISKALRS